MAQRRLINLTLHEQGEVERKLAASLGFDLMEQPMGVFVKAGQSGLDEAADVLHNRLLEAADKGHAVLIGGHTGAILKAVRHILRQGLSLPEMYVFETERVRDENGRFVFVPKGLLKI